MLQQRSLGLHQRGQHQLRFVLQRLEGAVVQVGLHHQRVPRLGEPEHHVGRHHLAQLHHAPEVLDVERHVRGLPERVAVGEEHVVRVDRQLRAQHLVRVDFRGVEEAMQLHRLAGTRVRVRAADEDDLVQRALERREQPVELARLCHHGDWVLVLIHGGLQDLCLQALHHVGLAQPVAADKGEVHAGVLRVELHVHAADLLRPEDRQHGLDQHAGLRNRGIEHAVRVEEPAVERHRHVGGAR
mmetsp:Transcript_36298/g.92766  ORF Transcript_36298/g.92766 Transcript_36298/m.92766 type:complete len:242 (-) Transcript_36298:172-897(-)